MKRKIIEIDEELCTGCGSCIPDCPEGALQIIDGKARLVSDLFCDGLGACIGNCPEGAISVIEREAEPYDERAVMETIVPQGTETIRAHLEHLAGHGQTDLYEQAITVLGEKGIPIPEHHASGMKASSAAPGRGHGAAGHGGGGFSGCPGSGARTIDRSTPRSSIQAGDPRPPVGEAPGSELGQWPVQLALLNPGATYFENADLLIAADCTPFAYAGFHQELLRGRILVIFCPKLDQEIEEYVEKLGEILSRHEIRSITVARMEVPCCGGVRHVVDRALERSGKRIPVAERVITIDGRLI